MNNTPSNDDPTPGQADSNAGAGALPNDARELARKAIHRNAPHPGGVENAAGMDHGAGAQKQADEAAEKTGHNNHGQ